MQDTKFSFNTIDNFDNHILKSIPNYDLLFSSILRLSEYFVLPNKTVYDLGCSTGKLLFSLKDMFPENKLVGIDSSVNLLPDCQNPIFIPSDLNNPYEFNNACMIYSIFTLQFLRRERRRRLIESVYRGLSDGGAFIIAEKVYVDSGQFQDLFTFSYYDYKKASFSEKEILDKEHDLRGILKPNTSSENLSMLTGAGFRKIECFYKYFMFEAYLCVK